MPRLAIIDFQGSSAMIANPLVAWMISDQRDGAVANANASQPVTNAAASKTRRARFVRAPRATAAIPYLILLSDATCPRSSGDRAGRSYRQGRGFDSLRGHQCHVSSQQR